MRCTPLWTRLEHGIYQSYLRLCIDLLLGRSSVKHAVARHRGRSPNPQAARAADLEAKRLAAEARSAEEARRMEEARKAAEEEASRKEVRAVLL